MADAVQKHCNSAFQILFNMSADTYMQNKKGSAEQSLLTSSQWRFYSAASAGAALSMP